MKKIKLLLILISIALILNGCREIKYRVSKFQRLDYSWVEGERDLKYLNNTMFKMLGMLDEYISRFDSIEMKPIRDLVAGFYPSEDWLADDFEILIKQYRQEMDMDFQYTKEIGEQGHITFKSTKLSKIINSFYVLKSRRATLDYSIFAGTDENARLRYIEGVYARHYGEEDNTIRRANALNKIKTIALVLKSLGCENVRIYTSKGTVPLGVVLIFHPSPKIQERLKIRHIEFSNFYDSDPSLSFCEEL